MLLLTAFIWGTAFAAQKSGMEYVEPFTFNAIRNLIGAAVLTPVIFYLRSFEMKKGEDSETVQRGGKKWLIAGGFCCGIVLFIAGSLQQIALQYTDAGKAGFITALYVVLVPVLGLFLKKKIRPFVWLCVGVSAAGLFLLCVPAGESFAGIGFGEILIFISAVWLAIHILVVDYFVDKTDGVRLSRMQFLVCGIISLIPMFLTETPELSNILACWLPILYTGVFSIGVAYTLQVVAQKNTDPTSASLILSLESVFSVIAGVLVLNERMNGREILGCLFMFIAIVASQFSGKTAESDSSCEEETGTEGQKG